MSKRDCISRLRAILASTKRKVDYMTAGKKDIFIFGAGDTASYYIKCFEAENIMPVAFLDNDPKKQSPTYMYGGGGL